MQKEQLRILSIGAHPDDCELSTGGISIKYREMGSTVKYLFTTNGDAGHQIYGGKKLADIRASEVKNACELVGIEYEIMDNHDGYLEASVQNRDRIIRAIRSFRPDIIFTHRLNDYHPDHCNTAKLVQDSSYLVRVPNICHDVAALNYSPIIMFFSDSFRKPTPFEPTVVVDIDDVLETKVKMSHCHRSQMYEWLPWVDGYEKDVPSEESEKIKWLTAKTIRNDGETAERFRNILIEKYGMDRGAKIQCAEAFELSEYGRQLKTDEIKRYFPF